jgi:hypothetical protein
MMEAARTSEMSVNLYQTTRRSNLEDSILIPRSIALAIHFSEHFKNSEKITGYRKI